MIYLKEWSVGSIISSPFTAPELMEYVLQGKVFGHPKHQDGKMIATSAIVKVEGKVVTTISGTVYRLKGKPCEDYLDFLDKLGIKFIESKPLDFTRKKNFESSNS